MQIDEKAVHEHNWLIYDHISVPYSMGSMGVPMSEETGKHKRIQSSVCVNKSNI